MTTPADVQATSDPRPDVVARLVHESWCGDSCRCGDSAPEATDVEYAQRILDVLDALRPDEATPKSNHCPIAARHQPHYRHYGPGGWCNGVPVKVQATPAPAGLTPTQEIRLEIFRHWDDPGSSRDDWAAWVEHGPDETLALEAQAGLLRLAEQRNAAVIRANEAEARADLAEARLGQVRDVLKDRYGMAPGDFADAVRDALARTPDDTATDEEAT